MMLYPKDVGVDFDWERILETHEIMYLVKRSSYEIVFAVPKRGSAYMSGERPLFQVRFKEQSHMLGIVLNLEEMEDFYEGLSRLMEYVQIEQGKRRETL